MSPRFRCAVCGKPTAGRLPRGGDGTFYYPRRHQGPDGKPCEGNYREALIEAEVAAPASTAVVPSSAPKLVSAIASSPTLPRVLAGHETPALERQAEAFIFSVAEMFEAWLRRTQNPNTQRAYRRDVVSFIEFRGIRWPEEAYQLLKTTVPDVLAWRDCLQDSGAAPSTIKRRIASLSGFFRFMREAATEARLPLVVLNPAHSQFIGQRNAEPIHPTPALTAARARQLQTLPRGDSILAYRDRAILAFYLYTGARIATGCRLTVADFH